MALFEEIEPPSSENSTMEANKNSKKQSKNQNQSYKTLLSFLAKVKNPDRLARLWLESKKPNLSKNFLLAKTFLPHIAVSFLVLVVVSSNFNDRVLSKAYDQSIISTGPDTTFAVADQVDHYTPLIKNDAATVEKNVLALENSNGFLATSGTVETQLTDRVQPGFTADGLPDNSANTVYYEVKNGDTLTGLGWKFEVKVATLKYLNDLDSVDMIKPGSKLKIPPKDYEVSAAAIAKKDKEKAAQLALASRNTVTRNSASSRTTGTPTVRQAAGSAKNGYPYGYCTYYVATRREVPSNWGDAKKWLSSAKNAGYQTGQTPAVGSIMVTSESWWGHVTYVENVDGDEVTVSEMNAKGWGVTDRRTFNINDSVIRGFIY